MKNSTYYSRISPVLWCIVWVILLGVFYLTIQEATENPTFSAVLILATIWLAVFALMLVIMLGIRYSIVFKELIVKIGPFTERVIPANSIWSLERSYNLNSAPANALKRLKVTYKDGEVLISPSREKDFIEEIKRLNPKVKLLNLKHT
ncbi:MAG: PH domain-containing protein [Cyclobacteriaceae bacterium]